jgi:hypothetical protein
VSERRPHWVTRLTSGAVSGAQTVTVDPWNSPVAITPAWRRDRGAAEPAPPPASSDDPDLRLRVIYEDGEALTVEVVNGVASHESLLYVHERGLFVIVATLRRHDRGTRIYLRLRVWQSALEWRA